MTLRFLGLLTALIVMVSGCSSNPDVTTAFDARVDEADIVVVDELDQGDQGDDAAQASADDVAIDDEPAVRVPDNGVIVEATNWLARTAMTSEFVELVWSPVEGAKTYRLYRLPTVTADYDAIATGDTGSAVEVFEGNEYGFIDRTAPTGTFLTYFVVAELNDGSTEPRWTEALTVDDVTPPSAVTGLTATITDDGILLEWEPSTDDVEFAAYNVSVLTPDGTAEYLGGGADIGQVSFLDTDPLDGENRYVVTAVDFHNNMSESATVTISN